MDIKSLNNVIIYTKIRNILFCFIYEQRNAGQISLSFETDSKIELLPPIFGGAKQKQNNLFATLKVNVITDDALTVLVLNVKSLSKHTDDIVSDKRMIYYDTIWFKERETSPSASSSKVIEKWNFFNTGFNNNENKFPSACCSCRNDIAI